MIVFFRRAAIASIVYFVACSDATAPRNTSPRALMVSENAACALDGSGRVFCWGQNTQQLEFGTTPQSLPSSATPVAVPVPALRWLASGVGTHLCGVTAERDAICWARDQFGQLGRGSDTSLGKPPAKVVGTIAWSDISVGRITTCGIDQQSNGYCWGLNQRGEIGDAAVALGTRQTSPHQIPTLKFKQVAAGWLHACGITTADDAVCWGANDSGQVGIGAPDTVTYRSPRTVIGGRKWKQLTVGSRYTCGLTTNDTAYCWGYNGTGQLGDGTTTLRAAPESVKTPLKFVKITAGSGLAPATTATPPTQLQGGPGHTCALTATGAAHCWGWNANGQLGNNSLNDALTPVPVGGGQTFDIISLGSASTCGMRGNAVWCWGSNTRAQLGRNTGGAAALTPLLVDAPFNKP